MNRLGKNQTSSKMLTSTVAAIILLLIAGPFSNALPAAMVNGQTSSQARFDFDSGLPTPVLRQGTPFDQTSGSVTAHFSSPQDPAAFSIQNHDTTFFTLSQFSGNYLSSNGGQRNTLTIRFSNPISNITLTYATIDYHDPGLGGTGSTISLTAYMDSTTSTPVGSSTSNGVFTSDSYPEGKLTFTSTSQSFNIVSIVVPFLVQGAVDFLVDNIIVTTASQTTDTTPPVTTINLGGVLGTKGWYTSNVAVSLSATDVSSTVTKTEYSFDNVIWSTYTAPFDVTSEGSTSVYYRSTDSAGNLETAKQGTVKIDKTAPTGSIQINNGNSSTTSTTVDLTLTQNDASSGVFQARYSNDGIWDYEQWETPSLTKLWTLTPGNGTKTLYYQIIDNAGLTSQTITDSILLKPTPTIDITKPKANAGQNQTVKAGDLVSFNAGASTDDVGIVSYTWNFGDGASGTGATTSHTFSNSGTYKVTLTVKDAAGNSDNKMVTVTVSPASGVGIPPWMLFFVVAIGVGASVTVFLRKRK